MLAVMLPVLAHAQSAAPARAAGATPQKVVSDSMAMSGPMVMPHQAVAADSKHLDPQFGRSGAPPCSSTASPWPSSTGTGCSLDVNKIACIDMPGMGAMGVHWAKPALVGDGKIDLTTPRRWSTRRAGTAP